MKYLDKRRQSVKIQENRKFFVLFYMLGFMAGILYANVLAGDYIASMGIFSDFFLNQYCQTEVHAGEFLWYILRVRAAPLLFLGIAGCTKFRKGVVLLFLVWTGFSCGMIMTAAVMQMGIKGVILCVVGLMPHVLFYTAGYVMLLWYLFCYPQIKWDFMKSVCFVLLIAVGVVLECYVNPALMKMFLKTL